MLFKNKLINFAIIILLSFFTVLLTSCNSSKTVEKNFPEIVEDLDSYKLHAKMQTIFQNGTKDCEVVVYFQKPNNYRVELTNAVVKEKQIMIRNDKGVYVILPSINKTFKVNSNWPNDSTQPFILHSLAKDILETDNLLSSNENGKTTLELNTKLFDNVSPIKEKIVFDNKSKLPKEIFVYRSNGELFNHIEIENIEKNPKLSNELFVVDNTITSSRLDFIASPIEFDRSITYPTFCPFNTKLSQEVFSGGDTDKLVVMKYSGDHSFTLLEKYVQASETIKTEYVYGNVFLMAGSFGLYSNNTLKFYSEGVEYTLATQNTLWEELLMVAESLGSSDIK